MNTDNKFRNRSLAIFLYIFGAAAFTVYSLVAPDFTLTQRLMVPITSLIIAMGLIFARRHSSEMTFGVILNLAFIAIGGGMSRLLHDNSVFFCVTIMQIVLSPLIMSSRTMKKQRWITFGCIIAYGILDKIILGNTKDLVSYCICTIALFGIDWLCVMITLGNERHTKLSNEFERSQDELIRVIETKCDEAREATRSKSEFLSNMSHEIRTPLNSILGMNELILRECTDRSIREYATISDSSGRLLLSLINDILDFSKIESGKMEIVNVPYRISSLILDNVHMLEQRFADKGLKLEIDLQDTLPDALIGDEMRIRQILTNLMSNALKYTDKGTVTLKVSHGVPENGLMQLRISVKDTGRGITEEDQKKLFSNFARVDLKNNRNIEGTGLGLAITSRLVSAMHGTIWVESTYGEGSEFVVLIPQVIEDETPVDDFNKLLAQKRSDNIKAYHESFTAPAARALVVDDTPSNLRVVQGLLKRTEIRIDTAASGAECLDMLLKGQYDIIFLDHMMPEMDGIETLKIIKKENMAPGVPIVALTANAVPGSAERYASYGFDAYLSKPVLGSALEELLLKLLPANLLNITRSDNPPEEKPPEKSQSSGEISAAAEVSHIDEELGMTYCGGMEELYAEMLSTYCEQSTQLLERLAAAYNDKDINSYRIVSHTVKGTSLTIGAKAMSEEALTQEMAAKHNDLETIEKGYEQFAADIKAAIEAAHKKFEEVNSRI